MKNTMKWKVVVPASIAALAMGLAGCGAGGDGGDEGDTSKVTASEGQATVSLYFWGGDARVNNTKKMVEKFEAANPNIKVDMQYNDWSGYWDKLNTTSAGGNAPDVMQMDELYLSSYASQGALLDLNRASDFLKLDTMDASLRDMGKVDGKQYAAPISTTPFGILVNNDVLSKLGLTLPDTTNWTWDDLVSFAQQVHDKSNGEIVGIAPMNNGMSLQLWARQNGESLFKDGKVAISDKTLAAYFQMAADWTKSGVAGTADRWSEQSSASLNQSDMGTNKQALTFTQATQITAYSKAAGTDNMELVPIPQLKAGEKTSYLKPGMYWSVSEKSQHPAEAAKLVDFLINNEEAGKIQGTERGLPANNSIRESLASTVSGTDKKALEFPDQIKDTIGDAPEVTPNGASSLDKDIVRYMSDVVFGKQTATDAAKAFISEMQGNIDSAV